MSLLNSLFAGVSGVKNHQNMMDVIGNNIANVNTIGFKGSRVTFSDAFNEMLKAGTSPTTITGANGTSLLGTGGTNSFQIGLGSKVNSIDRNWNQGTFESTGITTDLALRGPGLFVLKSNGTNYYSRAGSFTFDADGRLVNPQNGAVLQGKVASSDGVIPPGNNLEDIQIDSNMKLPAVATSKIKWAGNLKSSSDLTRSEAVELRGNIPSSAAVGDEITQPAITIYDESGKSYNLNVKYTKTAADTYDMSWSLTDSEKTEVAANTIPGLKFVENNGTMVLDDASKALVSSAANLINPTGTTINFTLDASTITENNSTQTLSGSADGNRKPNVVSGVVTIFDSLGNSHQVTLKFTKTDTNVWAWSASVPATSTLDGKTAEVTGSMRFNPDGTLDSENISPNNPSLTFVPIGGANPLVMDLDFGSGFGGITQTVSSSVVSALSQDGSASATLSDMNIDQYGNIVGIFTNGVSKTLAQIMVATFTNLNGLTSVGDNMYTTFANSGDARIGNLGTDTGTTVQSQTLEQSNVDLAEEFTKMIVAQRGFQANSKVITTSDSLLQEITNLVR
jgi:flagellar hook protein FlgE